MGHKIAEAIIENGRITYVDRKLPDGKIKIHLIYDIEEEPHQGREVTSIVRETAGIYENINVEDESHKLRNEWNRDIEE